jgi:ATP-dependent protease ClpP protease subunit
MNLLLVFIFLLNLYYSFSSNITVQKQSITLNSNNLLILKGEINDKLASKFIYELNKKEKKDGVYVYLDTNGGSVDAGNKIVEEILKYNLDCIASKAISMGFVILQSCNKRYITDYATLMQHQISYGIMNEKEKVESFVNYIKQVDTKLTKLQANKIGISPSILKKKTYNDWWLFGDNAIYENCADEIVNIECSSKLTNQNYTLDSGSYTYIYSKCPLVINYIDKFKNKNQEEYFFFI